MFEQLILAHRNVLVLYDQVSFLSYVSGLSSRYFQWLLTLASPMSILLGSRTDNEEDEKLPRRHDLLGSKADYLVLTLTCSSLSCGLCI